MSGRDKFVTRTIRLVGAQQRDAAISLLQNLPLIPDSPLELVVRKEKKTRGLDANARMWAGPLRDIALQGFVSGRQFSAEVWHEHFKREHLPEDDDPDLDVLVKDGYRKWDYTPGGERVLIGSTTMLTRRGFALYLQKVEADGASLGVLFHEAPGRYA